MQINPPRALIDKAGLEELLSGDPALLQRIVLAATPKNLTAMRTALEAQDSLNLYKLAHSLTGTVANFSAEEALTATRRLEEMARAGDLSMADGALKGVEEVVDRLQRELVEIVTHDDAMEVTPARATI